MEKKHKKQVNPEAAAAMLTTSALWFLNYLLNFKYLWIFVTAYSS